MGKIRHRILFIYLFLCVLIFCLLGVGIYLMSVKVFVKSFIGHHYSIATHIASSLDGKIHSTFKSENDIENPDYQHYFKYLTDVIKSEENITYLYTLNYDYDTKKLIYALDPYPITQDTIWFESKYFGLEIFLKKGKMIVKYDSLQHSKDFTIDYFGKQFNIKIANHKYGSDLYINNKKLLSADTQNSVTWNTPSGIIEPEQEVSCKITIKKEEIDLYYYFSKKGELSTVPGVEFQEDAETIRIIIDCIENGKNYIMTEPKKIAYGSFLMIISPIRADSGKNVGVLVLDISLHTVTKYKGSLYIMFFSVFFIVLLISFIISFIFARYITKPIEDLSKAVNDIENGNFKTKVNVKRNDEIGNLGKSFNTMTSYIDNLNSANSKFVPKEILTFLNRQNIIDLKLGDNAFKKMTIMFTDIRNFTSMSEKMNPQENFKFINSYLTRMGPIVRNNSGFIDKYIGDCIMALFPDIAINAVKTAVKMKEILKEYNIHRETVDYPEIKIGIGIHTGNLMIGIIGENERYEGTVISDAVNLASRLEGLTKIYDCAIIASEPVIKNLPPDSGFNYRIIDLVRVKGKNVPVNIYEIFDEDDPYIMDLKIATKDKLTEGINIFRNSDFDGALNIFNDLIRIFPSDTIINIYRDRCYHLLKTGVGAEWDGTYGYSE